MNTPIRVGLVSYLNAKPLYYGLAERVPSAELEMEVPSRLAQRLESGSWILRSSPQSSTYATRAKGIK